MMWLSKNSSPKDRSEKKPFLFPLLFYPSVETDGN